MISIKSGRELELMRKAGRINALAHQAVAEALRPGITTRELDQIAYKTITANGATPSFKGLYGYPATICASINDTLVHGIPDETRLKEGDIISIDIGSCYEGYHGDSAWTYAIGEVPDSTKDLMEVTKQCLFEGLKMVKPGNRLGDVSFAIGDYAHKHGYTVPMDYTGHGVGSALHEDPAVPNYGKPGRGVLLQEGMTLAIEPMINAGRPFTKTLDDGWTVKTKDGRLCAHYEHSIAITKDGYELLTVLEK